MDRSRYNFPRRTYGEISVDNNEVVTAVQVGSFTQVTVFDTNGFSYNVTPDHSQNHLTIKETGIYEALFCIHAENGDAQSHVVGVSLFAQNGTEEFTNVHSHTLMSGGVGDVECMSGGGFVKLELNETIELWATSDSVGGLNVVFTDVTLHLKKMEE